MTHIKTYYCFLFLAFSTFFYAKAQTTTVKIDPTIQRFIGETSELDRTKYFTMHSGSRDQEFDALSAKYDVHLGRSFWGPFSYAKSKTKTVGKYLTHKKGSSNVRPVQKGLVTTEHPANAVRYKSVDLNKAGQWASEYFKNYVKDENRAEFYEPMNEPFVHAKDKVYKEEQKDAQKMRVRMAEFYGAVGKAVKETPELKKMKMLGYSSAWPSYELDDFSHWHNRTKMFMDVAGEYMDGISTHLYDGVNVSGQDNKRSGSNSEAILDLIEAYSYIKWGTIKPHAITEYGGIEKGYGKEYSDTRSIQSVRAMNHIIFNLLEREDRMLITIPFNSPKAEWHLTEQNNYQPYSAVLWKPTKVTPTNNPKKPTIEGWEYTARIKFYELWKGVKGERVFIKSDNPDVQTHAFVKGKKLFVALNNLDDNEQKINLDFVSGLGKLKSVTNRSLKIYADKTPIYLEEKTKKAPKEIILISGQTSILVYQFKKKIEFKNSIQTTNYYSKTYLQPIVANKAISFDFKNVVKGKGFATLRMSIGRKHQMSKSPEVAINGTKVKVPKNWKGYDQAIRKDFFGMIEIPFSTDILKQDNTVTITFPDSGGHVSSLILSVEKCDGDCNLK